MFTALKNLILSKKYLFRNPNILTCLSRHTNNITSDRDLMTFYSCLEPNINSGYLSDVRYLGDISLFLSIGSLESVSLDGYTKQTLAQIIGINASLPTSNKTNLITAINEVHAIANNAFNTAGNGLTSSGTSVSVGAGNGISVNENDIALAPTTAGAGLIYTSGILSVGAGNGVAITADAIATKITTTTNKGGLEFDSTDQGLSIKLAPTSGLTTSGGSLAVGAGNGIAVNTNTIEAKIDGTTVTRSPSNALQTPILVRKADNSADTTIDIIVGGNTPTGTGKGLAKLNQDISVKDSLVGVSNALFTQKVPILLFQCQDSNVQTRTFLESVLKSPYNKETRSLSNGNTCLELALKVASGTPSVHTINASSKTDCQLLVTTTVNSLGNSAFKTAMKDSVYIAGAVTAEVCAQFFDT